MSRPPAITIRKGAEESVRRGHPWVWRDAIVKGVAKTGETIQIQSESGKTIGVGLFDANSPIAVRVWALGERPPTLDHNLFNNRATAAFRKRASIFADGKTTAYRLLNGEGDRCPGFVIDRYADTAVLRLDGDAVASRAEDLTRGLRDALGAIGITSLILRGRKKEAELIFGKMPEKAISVREHGVPFYADVKDGQKTGAFLDQRENRARVGEFVRERPIGKRRVLNLFSYAGGFSLHAALAGAHVTSVDIAAQAHATAQKSFQLAGLSSKDHTWATADAFLFLTEAEKKRERWDIVICDPPSLAPNEKAKARALAAYRTLHKGCAAVLAEDGIFCAASCSSHVDAESFTTTLDDATLGRELTMTDIFGPPSDHPTLPAWAEGRYLKFAVLR